MIDSAEATLRAGAFGLTMLCVAGLPKVAAATPAFDATTAVTTWNDSSPLVTDAEGLPLWDRIELHRDSDATLFVSEDVAPGHSLSDSAQLSPHMVSLFGSAEPSSSDFLLHYAPGWAFADAETPVLLIPGASTSASGVFGPLARSLASRGRAVFAISFPHLHGDCFQQAEHVADAVERILTLTGASQVDLVGHSKGGIAAAVYLGNRPGVDWGSEGRGARYANRGTEYRGDIRRFVALASPFGGVDTGFRWTAPHLLTAAGEDPLGPSAWTSYYPYTTTAPAIVEDLAALDYWPEGGDAFPGQAQLLAAWDQVHPLPGGRQDLGAFALQQDWLTTYEGGFGFYSWSDGIDSAIAAGGGFVTRLAAAPLWMGVIPALLAVGALLLSGSGAGAAASVLIGSMLVLRMFALRQNPDDRWAIVLSSLCLVLATTGPPGAVFAVVWVVWALLAPRALCVGAPPPPWLGGVAVAGALLMLPLVPRFGEGLGAGGPKVTGFSEDMALGSMGDLLDDPEPVFEATFDRPVTGAVYFAGVRLDK
ncbi:MAG: DUF3488 domain-containing protein, partial [Deltaproteobacteria bacterium]|nr:DUF3488 domain-containing protein [Deltaproteobacteria bacterium]